MLDRVPVLSILRRLFAYFFFAFPYEVSDGPKAAAQAVFDLYQKSLTVSSG